MSGWWVAAGDAVALILFALAGLRFHKIASAPAEVLRIALPLVLGWFALAAITRTYRSPGAWRFLATWAAGVPLGLVVRQAWVGRPPGPGFVVFLLVAMTLTLVFLLAWRALAASLRLVLRRRAPRALSPSH